MHVMVDGETETCRNWNVPLVENICKQAVELTGLSLIQGPFVCENYHMVCGIALLAESHVSVHLMKDTCRFHLDVFSCRPFDVEQIRALVIRIFGPFKQWGIHYNDRGDDLAEVW